MEKKGNRFQFKMFQLLIYLYFIIFIQNIVGY